MFTGYVLLGLFLSSISNPQRISVLFDYSYLGCPTTSSKSISFKCSSNPPFSLTVPSPILTVVSPSLVHGEYGVPHHSLSTKEEMRTSPSLFLKYSSFLFGSDSINISATCSYMDMYCTFTTPSWTKIQIKWYLLLICFVLAWNTGSSVDLTQLWLSHCMMVGSNVPSNKSNSSFLSQTTSLLTSLATIYSTSSLLNATKSWFLLIQYTIDDPTIIRLFVAKH